MIRPERDPHWCLGVEHGREGRNAYQFSDTENQKRYLVGYARGLCERQERLAAEQPTFGAVRWDHYQKPWQP